MNSCFRTVETGEFTDSDRTALAAMYTASVAAPSLVSALNPNRCLDVERRQCGSGNGHPALEV